MPEYPGPPIQLDREPVAFLDRPVEEPVHHHLRDTAKQPLTHTRDRATDLRSPYDGDQGPFMVVTFGPRARRRPRL